MTDRTLLDRGVAHTASIVFPDKINSLGTLFGGEAMRLMDECAGIAAVRCARRPAVTVAVDRIEFHVPIPGGSLIEISALVSKIGRTSMTVEVELWFEDLISGERRKGTTGTFVMVAVDEDGRPTPVDPTARPSSPLTAQGA